MLRRSGLCQGLNPAEVRYVADAVREAHYTAGQVICRQDETGASMFIVARGRIKLAVEEEDGQYQLLDYLGRGEHFGEMALLTESPRHSTASAVTDSELLELDRPHFEQLLSNVPGFAANLSRRLGFRLRWETGRRRRRQRPAAIALVNSTHWTRGLARPLAVALVASGDSVEVITDRPQVWPTGGEYLIERIPAELEAEARVAAVRKRLNQVMEHHDRVIVEVSQTGLERELPALVSPCEEIWWLVEWSYWDRIRDNLKRFLAAEPKLAERTRIVWVLHHRERFPPVESRDWGLAGRDLQIVLDEGTAEASRDQREGITRIVRHLQGIQVGVALGGGAARGMAHLGVLRALESEGIFFDSIAGTSSGALMGLAYAGGWEPGEALDEFAQALTPHRFIRALPGGSLWYMWTMFRLRAWDRMLRAYLGEATLEQLRIPFYTVTADLVTGKQVVRDSGDAIHAVLESINIPIVARPILRDGMVLVDGGILNNLPAEVLIARGADLVVGVDVVNRLSQQFAGNTPTTPTERMKRPGLIETVLRINEVQDYGATESRTGGVDLMITPDTSAFEYADFSRAHQLADAGQRAAEEAMPQLKQLLADVEGRR